MNLLKIIHLHEMESNECNLSCRGCYLNKPQEAPENNIDKLLPLVNQDTILTRAKYLNNLRRDPSSALGLSRLGKLLSNKLNKQFEENILVTDSITLCALTEETLFASSYEKVAFSPRTLLSSLDVLQRFSKLNFQQKLSCLFTVGIDSPKVLAELLRNGLRKVELNIAKPYSSETMFAYFSLEVYLTKYFADRKNGMLYSDSCINFKRNNKNCSDPQDGEIEITVIGDSVSYYSCAYSSNRCIVKEAQ